ncbi:MAG: porin family protein [Pseudomonadota bacterium]
MKKLIFALIAGAAAMSAAQAQNAKPYIGLGVASSSHNFDLSGATSTDAAGTKSSAKIFGGVELTPTFGIEAGYTDLRKADHSFVLPGTPGVNGTATTDGSRSYVAGKANFPLNDKFALYGKLGAGYSKVDVSSATPGVSRSANKTELYGALGGQYNISEKVALTLEYERYGKQKDFGAKADAITVAGRYNF